MPWNNEFECMPIDTLKKFQLEKLKETVEWVTSHVPFYKRKFQEKGITAEDIRNIEDISGLPFTVKNDLRDNYPFGICAVPARESARIHTSSGTTGKPVTTTYTEQDIDALTECVARGLWAYGVRKDDIVQNAYGYGLFTGGLGLHQGISRIGATVLPISTGSTELQVNLMKDFQSTVLCSTPSYALTIAEEAMAMGIDIKELPLKIGVFGAEPWCEKIRRAIEDRMGIKAMDIFGLTEMGGPGMAYECRFQNGSHINEDHYLAEIVDPATLEPLPFGEKGELVLTSLQRRAMPLIRYRTKDITRLSGEDCPCGRTFVKMEKISGRTDDMLIINGVNVFPSQIESFLLDIREVDPQYRLIVQKRGYLDKLTVQVEAKKEVYAQGMVKKYEVEAEIMAHIKGTLGIRVNVDLVEPGSIARSQGKAIRVVDERPDQFR